MTAQTDTDTPQAFDAQRLWSEILKGSGLLEKRPFYDFDPGYHALAMGQLPPSTPQDVARLKTQGIALTRYQRARTITADLDDRLLAIVTHPALTAPLAGRWPGAGELAFELIALGDIFDHRFSDFSERHYLALYPDIRRARIHAFEHFILHGIRENRETLRSIRRGIQRGAVEYDDQRPTVAICSHELSRTGAPVVALDLARSLSASHNVVVLALRGGEILAQMRSTSCMVVLTERPEADLAHLELPELSQISFAILNSFESTAFSAALTERGIPQAAYIHEYADYILPRQRATKMAMTADLLVFSAEPVRLSWLPHLIDAGVVLDRDTMLLPQYQLESQQMMADDLAAVRQRAEAQIGQSLTGRKLVVAAGQMHWRKGSDIFAMAAQTFRLSDPDLLFVWVGDGPDQEDFHFGVWMTKHFSEAIDGAHGPNFIHLPAGPWYSDILKAADVFFLPSRLDPLPNVVFDAARSGARIVTFKGGTGFDDPHYDGFDNLRRIEFGNFDAMRQAFREAPHKIGRTGPEREPTSVSGAEVPQAGPEILKALAATVAARRHYVVGSGSYDIAHLTRSGAEAQNTRRGEREKLWSLDRRGLWSSGRDAEAALRASDHWMHRAMRVQDRADIDLSAAESADFCLHYHADRPDRLGPDFGLHPLLRQARRVVLTVPGAEIDSWTDRLGRLGINAELRASPHRGSGILAFLDLFRDSVDGSDDIWCHVAALPKRKPPRGIAVDSPRSYRARLLLGQTDEPSAALALMANPAAGARTGLVLPFEPRTLGWGTVRRHFGLFDGHLPGPLPDAPLITAPANPFWTRSAVARKLAAAIGPHLRVPHGHDATDGTLLHLVPRVLPAAAAALGLMATYLENSEYWSEQ